MEVAPAVANDGLAAPPQPEPEKQMPTVLCCMCSLPIPPNPTSMCVLCIRTQVDITEGIATNLTMHQCRGCKRYLRPGWVECKLESRELMAVCLRKVRARPTAGLRAYTAERRMRLSTLLTH